MELLKYIRHNTVDISFIAVNKVAIGVDTQEEFDDLADKLRTYGRTVMNTLMNGRTNTFYIDLISLDYGIGYSIDGRYYRDKGFAIVMYRDIIIDWSK